MSLDPVKTTSPSLIVYDAGALLAADRRDPELWKIHVRAVARRTLPLIPAPVLVQAWRDGARQANLARLLKSAELVALDGIMAQAAGQLCGRASTSDVTDAVVAVVAGGGPTLLVTSDPDDLAHLLAHVPGGERVEILTV